jgi:hypothetical protein
MPSRFKYLMVECVDNSISVGTIKVEAMNTCGKNTCVSLLGVEKANECSAFMVYLLIILRLNDLLGYEMHLDIFDIKIV